MATSNVSALDQDTWTLIATNTTTSGSTSTFSGLSGYKKYMVAWEGVSRTTSGAPVLTFNGSTSNYWGGVILLYSGNYQTGKAGIRCSWSTFIAENNGSFIIENANNNGPKIVTGGLVHLADEWQQDVKGGWNTIDPITSITFTTASGTWSAGSMKLYGIAG